MSYFLSPKKILFGKLSNLQMVLKTLTLTHKFL